MAKSKQPVLLTMEKEAELRAKGFTAVCGIDEAGRGPLAGPVVAAAVILPEGIELPGVNDSKKITEKKREVLFDFVNDVRLPMASVRRVNRKLMRSIFCRRRFSRCAVQWKL